MAKKQPIVLEQIRYHYDLKENEEFYFLLNHNDKQASLTIKDNLFINIFTQEEIQEKLILNSCQAAILEKDKLIT